MAEAADQSGSSQSSPGRRLFNPQYFGWVGISLLALLIVFITFSRAPIKKPKEGQVTLRIKRESLPDLRHANIENVAKSKRLNYFLNRHPEILLEQTVTLRIRNIRSTELLGIAAEIAPDVIYLPFFQVQTYVDEGFIQDITSEIENWEDRKYISDTVWPVAMRDGRYYGIPADMVHVGITYNTDLVSEAGLDPDNPPKTWDELFHWAQLMTDRDKVMYLGDRRLVGRWGLGWLLHETMDLRKQLTLTAGEIFANLVWQMGGEMAEAVVECPHCGGENRLVNQLSAEIICEHCKKKSLSSELKKRYRVTYDSSAAVEALKIVQKFKWAHWFRDSEDRIVNLRDSDGKLVVTKQQFEKLLATNGGRYKDEYGQVHDLKDLEKRNRIIRGVINGAASPEDGFGAGLGKRDFVVFAKEAERCAMRIGYPYNAIIQHVEAWHLTNYGFAPLPTVKGGKPANLVRGYVYAVNAQIKDPRKRKAAIEYIKYICSEKAREIYTDHFISEDWGNLVNSVWLKRLGHEDIYQSLPKAWRNTSQIMEARARLTPVVPKYPHIQEDKLKQPLQEILFSGGKELDLQKILSDSAKEVNTSILGERDPKDMAGKRKIALVVLAVVVGLIGFAFYRTFRALSSTIAHSPAGTTLGKKRRLRQHLGAWAFLLPAVAVVLMFRYYPLFRGSVMAFFDWKLLGAKTFIGLDNFIEIFSQHSFYTIVLNTVYYVSLTMTIGFLAPIALALLLSEVPRCKVFFRVVFYLPSVTTVLVIMFLWLMLYDTSPEGFLNTLLNYFGVPPQKWLDDPSMAMICIVIPFIWAGAGAGCIIYLAALHGVPEQMYEAAEIDGAGARGKLWHITLPYLKPLLIINFVGAFIGSFHATANILMMTGGGPLEATKVMGIEIFSKSFLYLKFGYATALAWIMGAFLIGFTLQQLKILGKVEFTTVEK